MAKKRNKFGLVVTDDPENCACPKCGEKEDITRFCWGCLVHYCNACSNQFDVRTPEQMKSVE